MLIPTMAPAMLQPKLISMLMGMSISLIMIIVIRLKLRPRPKEVAAATILQGVLWLMQILMLVEE